MQRYATGLEKPRALPDGLAEQSGQMSVMNILPVPSDALAEKGLHSQSVL
jgi:hypothetical protein